MHFSLVSPLICALIATVVPFVGAQGTLSPGTYRLESAAFDSPVLVLDLSAFDPTPGTPILVFQSNGGGNQHWTVATSGSGYTLRALNPSNTAFVDSVGAGALLTATPNNKTTFLFNQVGADNTYQIIAAINDGAFALQAPADVAQVTLETLDATNLHQIWRLVAV